MECRTLLTVIDLSNLVGVGTTIFPAGEVNEFSGASVSNAGDVNGDGYDDLVIGASAAGSITNQVFAAGEIYIVYGQPNMPPEIDLGNLGAGGVTIYGAFERAYAGGFSSGGADVNGDGYADVIVGAMWSNGTDGTRDRSGASYIIFGGASLPSVMELENLGALGVAMSGADVVDLTGIVGRAGDINGDGLDDVVVGGVDSDGPLNVFSATGEVQVVFGRTAWPEAIDFQAPVSGVTTIYGAEFADGIGRSVSVVGDVNGDGFEDLLFGALADGEDNATRSAGESYLLLGRPELPTVIDLAADGAELVIPIYGAEENDRSGLSVSGGGDINGDGLDDLVIGAYRADGKDNAYDSAGDTYVVFGREQFPELMNLRDDDPRVVVIHGADPSDQSGRRVSVAGDVNGDGYDDVLIAAAGGHGVDNLKEWVGESYLIWGGPELPQTIELATIDEHGLFLPGVDPLDYSGTSVSGAEDLNGDGYDDFVIGALRANGKFNDDHDVGETYVIYGGDFTASVTHQGTSVADRLDGDVGDNVLVGGDSDDTLFGNGGGDVFRGGAGDDVFVIPDTDFRRILGGNGNDTLSVSGRNVHLDLTQIADNRIVDIERVDISGSGPNTLTLDFREVVNLSSNSNTLFVAVDPDDVVNIGPDWTRQPDETIGSQTFIVYTQGIAVLRIGDKLKPDLVPVALAVADDDLLDGQTEVALTIGNIGNADAGPFLAHMVWSTNERPGAGSGVIVQGSVQTFVGLEAGGHSTRTVRIRLAKSDLYAHAVSQFPVVGLAEALPPAPSYLHLVVDSTGQVVESNETNNSGNGQSVFGNRLTYFPWDINADGTVTPRDALAAILAINTSDLRVDFDGNWIVTPLEALAVVHRIGYTTISDSGEDISPTAAASLTGPIAVPATDWRAVLFRTDNEADRFLPGATASGYVTSLEVARQVETGETSLRADASWRDVVYGD